MEGVPVATPRTPLWWRVTTRSFSSREPQHLRSSDSGPSGTASAIRCSAGGRCATSAASWRLRTVAVRARARSSAACAACSATHELFLTVYFT